jgi:threonylcarbamoyladenosine tRNA methylthiotransferase MtaB
MGEQMREVGSGTVRSVALTTIGCKLNQFETEQMREAFEAAGYETIAPGEKADVYVINTCTVTSKSDYRSRQAVRRAVKANPEAKIVVTGCYAQLAPQELAGIPGVDLIIGNAEKGEITRLLSDTGEAAPRIEITAAGRIRKIDSQRCLRGFGSYTRAFVKIQDGCDNRCSYCAVPLARGGSRSKPTAEVTAEIQTLVQEGYKEIVLTGVHLGSYGKDLSPACSLADLLRETAGLNLERVRLSSIEPTDFSDELIDLLADPAMRICPHVHIPLQSGDDRILKLMGRNYTGKIYADLIDSIKTRLPLCGIGADVMVGFPTEDEKAFTNTYDLVRRLPITYLHVFSFSPRYNTSAACMEGRVDPERKKVRSRRLRRLGLEKSLLFRQSLIGQDLDVLVLATKKRGITTGLSGNYVRVSLDRGVPENSLIRLRVSSVTEGGMMTAPAGAGKV